MSSKSKDAKVASITPSKGPNSKTGKCCVPTNSNFNFSPPPAKPAWKITGERK